ncbi:MAG: hypothetical protein MK132_14135 [Lentisphaerales bacterium]|nr:hypothetical protein [Lentisphaerales bacterium]
MIVENEKGQKVNPNWKKGEEKVLYDHKKRTFNKSGGWIDVAEGGGRLETFFKEKSVKELLTLKSKASRHELTLIIEELLVRKESSIPALASFLSDQRLAVFQKGREYWWYEKKNQPPEPVSIAVYAAYALQKKVPVQPSGVTLGLTKDRMFYAVKGGFAVVKDDVQRVWKEWWSKAENDY